MKNEKGEVMLEGMIIVILTMFLLVWILGVGFLYYQKYLVTAVTNDTAVKIATTYNVPDSDIIMGYVEPKQLTNRPLYRNLSGYNDQMQSLNKARAKNYVTYMLKKTNFSGVIEEDNIKVTCKVVKDGIMRQHIEVDTECTFNTPFGIGLSLFGMGEKMTYKVVGRYDCTEKINYYANLDFAKIQISELDKIKVIDLVHKLIGVFNKGYSWAAEGKY